MHSNPKTLSTHFEISYCFVVAMLSQRALQALQSADTLATKEVVILSDNCRLPSHFASLISLRVTYGARPPSTRSAKRRHEVTNDTCQIIVSYSLCKKNIHLKFSTIWWTKPIHFLLKSVEMGRWRALACLLACLLAHLLTHSRGQKPSWGADRFSAREIPRILWSPKVHYRV